MLGPTANVAFLVALAFAVAASANVPVILFSIYWKRFNTSGAVWGLIFGLVGSILLIMIGPSIMGIDPPTMLVGRHAIQHAPIFPLENPGILSVPIGFGAILGTLLARKMRMRSSASKNSKFGPLPDSVRKRQLQVTKLLTVGAGKNIFPASAGF